MSNVPSRDAAADDVVQWLLALPDLEETLGDVLRRSFDEVLDGQRTGRWRIEDLEKTEKTYIGTKVEILLREALGLPEGATLDYEIAGHEVDCKFSLGGKGWAIPLEAQNRLCLLIAADDDSSLFSVGVLRCAPEVLTAPNRDRKRGVGKTARAATRWLYQDAPMPRNLLRSLPDEAREQIVGGEAPSSGQARVDQLFRLAQGQIVRRETTLTVAQQADPMKRARDSRLHLLDEGVLILGHQGEHPRIAEELGLPVPRKGELVSVRVVPCDEAESAPRATVIGGRNWRVAASDDPTTPGPDDY
ncbi:MAG: NaeI family type II restriction endonuclease [Acidimicrobiales bacterium]